MTDNTMPVRVAMMGPTRSGKTTLLTAILDDARRSLAGKAANIGPSDTQTEERIQQNADELKGCLLAGEFRPGNLRGTREVQRFGVMVSAVTSPGAGVEGVRFEFLDFPGGDLHPATRNAARWAEVQEFLSESTALLIPVDATVFMEAYQPRHQQEAPRVLRLAAVEEAVRYWAKFRRDMPDEPALMILAPVKCESYFADNGGHRDASGELFAQFRDVYAQVIEAAKSEVPHVRVAYVPVDSLGCVEVESVRWVRDEEPASDGDSLTPDVQYLVRPGKRRHVVGAVDVLVPLVRQVVDARRAAQNRVFNDAKRKASAAVADRDRRRGFWAWVSESLDGSRQRRRLLAAQTSKSAGRELKRLEQYDAVLVGLAEQPAGSRVKSL